MVLLSINISAETNLRIKWKNKLMKNYRNKDWGNIAHFALNQIFWMNSR